MFDRIDKKLVSLYKFIEFFLYLFAALKFIAAIFIVFIIADANSRNSGIPVPPNWAFVISWYFVVILFFSTFFGFWFFHTILDVVFGYLCDVKLIRNKLYDNNSDILTPILNPATIGENKNAAESTQKNESTSEDTNKQESTTEINGEQQESISEE